MKENQFGVILEEVRDMFKTVAEGQQVIAQDVETMKQDVAGIKQDVARLDLRVSVLEENAARIEGKLDVVVQQTAGNAEKLTDHESRIIALEKAANQ